MVEVQHLREGAIQTVELGIAPPPEAGAVLSFAGTVRNHHQGRAVRGIHYHAYRPLAESTLATLEQQALEQFELAACAVHHAVGELLVGDISVYIQTASAHRDAAYAANRWLIDSIKQSVPIWKQEHYSDGLSSFVAGQTIREISG